MSLGLAAGALFELRLAMGIDVTTPGSTGRRRDGIRVHSGMTLTAADVTVIDNIPCTSLARTLLDVAEDATRRAFHADRRRDQRLLLLGWRVVRFTWRQVFCEPAYVAATLRGLLARAAADVPNRRVSDKTVAINRIFLPKS